MTLHKNIPLGGMHKPYNWEYANAAARTGAAGLTAEDVGKIARQLDDNSLWMLINHSPVTWVQQGAGSGTPILADGSVPFVGDQSMGGNKLIDLDAAAAAGDAVRYDEFSTLEGDVANNYAGLLALMARIDDVEDYSAANARSGFKNYTADSTVSFNEATRLFEITVNLAATFEVWTENTKFDIVSDSVTISNVTGEHWIYFDLVGNLIESVNPTAATKEEIIKNLGLVTIIYWNATTGHRIWRGDERHGTAMAGATHYHFHETLGAFLESGGAPTSISADQDGSLDAHAQVGMASAVLHDEDLEHTLAAKLSTADWHTLYKTGGTGVWARVDPKVAFPVANAGTGRLAWNEFTGATWQLTEASNNSFVLTHIFATNDPDDPYMAVVGEAEYGNINDARTGAANELAEINTEGLPTPESAWIATIIYQTSNSYGNTVKARIRTVDGGDYIDWRTERLTGAASSTNDHGSLSGLDDADHPVEALYLPVGTAGVTDMVSGRDWWNYFTGSCAISGFALTDNGDGTVDIAAGEALLRTSDSDTADMQVVQIPATAGLALTDNSVNFINVRWNAGSPEVRVTTTYPLFLSEAVVHLTVRHGTTIHHIDVSRAAVNSITKNGMKDVGVYGYEHVKGGTVITHTGTRNMYVTPGIFYLSTARLLHPAFDTSGADSFTAVYEDGLGGWTRVAGQTQISNTQYDDGSGALATLGTNKYGIYWVYLCQNTPPALNVLYGRDEYDTLAEAQAVGEYADATRPPEMRDISTAELIGKIIVLKNAASFADIQQPWDDFLASTTPSPGGSGTGFEAVTITQSVSSGTEGGGSTGAAWNKRPLNTLTNPKSYSWVTFDDANDRFDLATGFYHISIKAQVFAAGKHQLRLRADPAGAPSTQLTGSSQHCPYWNEEASQEGTLEGVFELLVTETFQVEHFIEQTVGTYGLGKAVSSGEDETYCTIQIAKLGA